MKIDMALEVAREEIAKRDGTIAETKMHKEPHPTLGMVKTRNGQYVSSDLSSPKTRLIPFERKWTMEQFVKNFG